MADPPPPGPDDTATVRSLLAAAGLNPPDDDVRTVVAQYDDVRRQLTALWAVDVGEGEPATIYRATPFEGPQERR